MNTGANNNHSAEANFLLAEAPGKVFKQGLQHVAYPFASHAASHARAAAGRNGRGHQSAQIERAARFGRLSVRTRAKAWQRATN